MMYLRYTDMHVVATSLTRIGPDINANINASLGLHSVGTYSHYDGE